MDTRIKQIIRTTLQRGECSDYFHMSTESGKTVPLVPCVFSFYVIQSCFERSLLIKNWKTIGLKILKFTRTLIIIRFSTTLAVRTRSCNTRLRSKRSRNMLVRTKKIESPYRAAGVRISLAYSLLVRRRFLGQKRL